jgi:hypothetical protein
MQGLIRRIGDGRTTNIWSDNWLPRDNLMKPLRSLKINAPQKVCELIDATSAKWKEELIREVFLPMDAAAILSIPLGCS